MKVYKFAPPYSPGKTKGSTRTTFPDVRGEHPGMKWTQCVAEGYRRYKHSK